MDQSEPLRFDRHGVRGSFPAQFALINIKRQCIVINQPHGILLAEGKVYASPTRQPMMA